MFKIGSIENLSNFVTVYAGMYKWTKTEFPAIHPLHVSSETENDLVSFYFCFSRYEIRLQRWPFSENVSLRSILFRNRLQVIGTLWKTSYD